MEHFSNPRNVGELPNANAVGLVGAMRWGDALKLMLRVESATDRIAEARFQTFGCSGAIATSSAVTEMVAGKTTEEALAITAADIADFVGGLPAEQMYCAVMACEALRLAIDRHRGADDRAEAALLCKCAGVSEEFVERTIRANRLTDPEQVTFHTKAGRGCIACFRQIETVLARVDADMAADGVIATRQVYRVGSAEPRIFEVKPRGGHAPMPKAPPVGASAARPPVSRGSTPRLADSLLPNEKRGSSEQIRLIEKAIDALRPHLQRDGGDCELVDIDGNTVFVKLTGSCVGCQLASVTLSGVQAQLVDKLGLPLRVVPVQ